MEMVSSTAPVDIAHLQTWVGRTESQSDMATGRLIEGLIATLDIARHFPSSVGQAPLTLHWCLAPPIKPMSELGPDGHPARGGFLPPVPLPRRMWAGGELEILDRIVAGDTVERVSRIAAVELKHGRSGPLCFVRVDHAFRTARGLAVRERQDIVYRAAEPAAVATSPRETAPEAAHSLTMRADPVLLFRYSALTFNGHRIHYDRPYAMEEEHYPGLVVHGPLQAALLLEFCAELRHGRPPRRFSFRGVRPLTDGADFQLKALPNAQGMAAWVENAGGEITMRAQAEW